MITTRELESSLRFATASRRRSRPRPFMARAAASTCTSEAWTRCTRRRGSGVGRRKARRRGARRIHPRSPRAYRERRRLPRLGESVEPSAVDPKVDGSNPRRSEPETTRKPRTWRAFAARGRTPGAANLGCRGRIRSRPGPIIPGPGPRGGAAVVELVGAWDVPGSNPAGGRARGGCSTRTRRLGRNAPPPSPPPPSARRWSGWRRRDRDGKVRRVADRAAPRGSR